VTCRAVSALFLSGLGAVNSAIIVMSKQQQLNVIIMSKHKSVVSEWLCCSDVYKTCSMY